MTRIPCLTADYIVDIGPGAGEHGGEVVATGNAQEIMNTPGSVTGDYLSGRIRNSGAGKEGGADRISKDCRGKGK